MKQIIISSKKHGSKVVLVDDEDFDLVNQFKWGIHKNGNAYYVIREEKGNGIRRGYKMHRVIMNVSDKNVLVDHKDRNGLNNQRNNLRICNKSQNAANSRSVPNSTSKFLGVSWNKRAKKWFVQVKKNYKRVYAGYFDSEEDAAKAYSQKSKEIHGEFAAN